MSALKVKEEKSNSDFHSVSFDVNCNDQLICQRNNIFLNAQVPPNFIGSKITISQIKDISIVTISIRPSIRH